MSEPKLDLKPVRMQQTIEMGDESGYRFTIDVAWDDEYGWHGAVSMSSFGLRTPEAAVDALRPAAEHFLRMLAGSRSPEGTEGER